MFSYVRSELRIYTYILKRTKTIFAFHRVDALCAYTLKYMHENNLRAPGARSENDANTQL